MFILFCPECGAEAQAPESMIGQLAECPSCKAYITIKQPSSSMASVNKLPPSLPTSVQSTKACPYCSETININAILCKHCRSNLTSGYPHMPQSTDGTISSLSGMETASGVIWIVIAILQIIMVYTIIAGVWNLIAGFSRFGLASKIRERSYDVPELYEGIGGLIAIAVINLLLGGVIGLAAVAFDFYIRNEVLKNRHLFTENYQLSQR